MSRPVLQTDVARERFGLKGPRAVQWLEARGVAVPAAPNSWTGSRSAQAPGSEVLVARLGGAEFFVESQAAHEPPWLTAPDDTHPAPGVYPLLREDAGFRLSGDGVHDVLSQVCSIDFAALHLAARPVLMTSMVGVSVLVLPQAVDGARTYRIWCDPTFGTYLEDTLAMVVIECGGTHRGELG